ncbi:MAG: LysR family transcriptional regulator [Rhodobacteraceae bacterium]|nr:LysR family transcriptional regulator [Paracoccaceae bacterium]
MLYLSLRHYAYVTAIGQEASISGAAARLNVSQPAISNALARVEEHLGYPLFIRTRGSAMMITPQGRQFIAQAEALLAQATQIEHPGDAPATAHRSLRLGCFTDLAPFLLAPTLHALRAAMPDVTVSCQADGFEALVQAMLKGQVDLVISYDLAMDAGFDRNVLYQAAPVALFAKGHALSAAQDVSLADLAAYPLILSEEGLSSQHMLGLFRRQGLSPIVAHRAGSVELMRSLAGHGEGVGVSYANPPADISYDGMQVLARPIRDASATESVVVARHGTGPAHPVVAQAQDILTELWRAD